MAIHFDAWRANSSTEPTGQTDSALIGVVLELKSLLGLSLPSSSELVFEIIRNCLKASHPDLRVVETEIVYKWYYDPRDGHRRIHLLRNRISRNGRRCPRRPDQSESGDRLPR